ncbi:MAG: helix-turn-helix transcriptional regulator [Chloroflexi bacterium]|nr:helix-turn-helix transcriptional regulator [Chloroflexota bacterium]
MGAEVNRSIRAAIGERLRKARTELGLTEEYVAGEIGADAGAVSRWERKGRLPRVDYLIGLARLYGRTAEWIVTGENQSDESEYLEGKLKRIREEGEKYSVPRDGFRTVTVNLPMGGVSEGLPDEVVATDENVQVIAAAIRLAVRPRRRKRKGNE